MQLTQVRKGERIQTPQGPGVLVSFGEYAVGDATEVAYVVALDGQAAHVDFAAEHLRPINPGRWFPEHQGEILRRNA